MSGFYYFSVTVHVLAALFWLGGMFFLAVVGAPVLRKVEPPSLRAELFRKLGEGFRTGGWVAIVLLLLTGVGNLYGRGLADWGVLSSAAFWSRGYGRLLFWKLVAVTFMVVASALHDFWLGPRAGRLPAGSPEALKMRTWAGWLARANALVGLLLVLVAVRLARG